MTAGSQTGPVSGIDKDLLGKQGWLSFNLSRKESTKLATHVEKLAVTLGTPIPMRAGGGVCDVLQPTHSIGAKRQSLSQRYSLGKFPLHVDTAHWITPCHYVVLACLSPGSGNRPTLLLDTQTLPLHSEQARLLHQTPLRVKNGRSSFFSTILSRSRPFVRLDPGCMAAVTDGGHSAIELLSCEKWPEFVESIRWEIGQVVILDNWRTLHGRDESIQVDFDRTLLRVGVA